MLCTLQPSCPVVEGKDIAVVLKAVPGHFCQVAAPPLPLQVSASKQLEISQDWVRVHFHGRKISEMQ